MTYTDVPSLLMDDIFDDIGITPTDIDDFIIMNTMYSQLMTEKLMVRKPHVIDDMIYDVLEQFDCDFMWDIDKDEF